jgi:hypothetical protein
MTFISQCVPNKNNYILEIWSTFILNVFKDKKTMFFLIFRYLYMHIISSCIWKYAPAGLLKVMGLVFLHHVWFVAH